MESSRSPKKLGGEKRNEYADKIISLSLSLRHAHLPACHLPVEASSSCPLSLPSVNKLRFLFCSYRETSGSGRALKYALLRSCVSCVRGVRFPRDPDILAEWARKTQRTPDRPAIQIDIESVTSGRQEHAQNPVLTHVNTAQDEA